tara:strand:- start:678 stop:2528 length:1851 start_codon:yes stop_codon:yes gene_type:complete
MAKLAPSGVLKLPNLAELDFKLREKETQDRLRADEYSSKFDEIQGNFLAADMDAVQGAYDPVENSINALAQNPNDPTLRRNLRKAFSTYSQVAGTAKFLADNNRSQKAMYMADPDKFGLRFDQFEKDINQDALGRRSVNDILERARNPYTAPLAYTGVMADPNKLVDILGKNFNSTMKDYIMPEDGKINQTLAETRARNIIKNKAMSPQEQQGAMLFQALKEDLIGDRSLKNPIRREDVDLVNSQMFRDSNPELLQRYTDDVINSHLANIPQLAVDAYTRSVNEKKARDAREKTAKANVYSTLKPTKYDTKSRGKSVGVETGKVSKEQPWVTSRTGFLYDIGGKNQTVPMSDSEDIVQFGVMYEGENPIEYVTVKDTDKTERKLDSNGDIMYDPKDGMPVITKYVTKTREMTATERSALEAKIPNFSELMNDITVEKQSDDNKVSIDNRLDESLNNIGEGNDESADAANPGEEIVSAPIYNNPLFDEIIAGIEDKETKTIYISGVGDVPMPGRGGSNPPTSGSADPDEGIMASNNEEPTISRGDGRTTRQDVLDALIAEQEELEKKAKSGQTLSKEERERKNRIAGEIKDMEGLILESPESGQLAMMSAPINNKKS